MNNEDIVRALSTNLLCFVEKWNDSMRSSGNSKHSHLKRSELHRKNSATWYTIRKPNIVHPLENDATLKNPFCLLLY